ncbi:MAG: class I adenylate-forming enzyme family protein [Alphaproteobacteria bacterium]
MPPRMPESRTVPELVAELARRYPDREALIGGGIRWHFADVAAEVSRLAAAFRKIGVAPGGRVGILMGNRPEWVPCAFAAMHLGASVVGLNTWLTAPELAYQLAHAQVRWLVVQARFAGRDLLALTEATGVPLDRVIVVDGPAEGADRIAYAAFHALGDGPPPAPAARPADPGFILYTSGSTARPKCVPLQHFALIENMWHIGERQHLTPDDRLWLAVSLFWSLGCVNALFAAWTHGSAIVLQERFDAGEALALIEREGCTAVYATPNMALALWEHPDRPRRDLSSLRTGVTIGTPEQVQRLVDLGAREICNVYGLTEVYGNCAVTDAHDPLARRLAANGRPLPGVTIRIVDPATRMPLPDGETGEILVRGYVTPGYLDGPDVNAAAFTADGWFVTGDLGLIDDAGQVRFRGRLKEMIKTGGINLAPAEVEAVLCRHPGVETAFVIGLPDARRDEVVAAVIVPRDEAAPPDEAALQAHCRANLAAYKVPRRLRVIPGRDLPLTTTGKIQRSRLAELFVRPHA